MARLLIVQHTSSPSLQEMLEAAMAGAGTDEIDDVQVVVRPALTAGAADVLEADGYLLGTPANIGYMSGALKHFFDTIYYPCLVATERRPYALYVHGDNDAAGAVRAVEAIATGLKCPAGPAPATWKPAGSWVPPSRRSCQRDRHHHPQSCAARQLCGGADQPRRVQSGQQAQLPRRAAPGLRSPGCCTPSGTMWGPPGRARG